VLAASLADQLGAALGLIAWLGAVGLVAAACRAVYRRLSRRVRR